MTYRSERLCPYLEHPLDECYINEMNSQTVQKAIHYCGFHYEECEIYKRRYGFNQLPRRGKVQAPSRGSEQDQL